MGIDDAVGGMDPRNKCEGDSGISGSAINSLVIAGLDPAIHVGDRALLLSWTPGDKPKGDK